MAYMLSNHYQEFHRRDVISSKKKGANPHQHTSHTTSQLQVKSDTAYYVSRPPKEIRGIPWKCLRDEWYRLMTFVMYPPDSSVSSIILASKGFVYPGTGSDYTVMCYFCKTVLDDIRIVDDIDIEHIRLNIDCPMVSDCAGGKCDTLCMENRYPENAKTILSNFLASRMIIIQSASLIESISSTASTSGSDTSVTNTNSSHNETHSNSHTHQDNTQQDNATSNGSEGDSSQPISYHQLGIITAKPKRPEYAVLASRLGSFKEWPKRHHLNPEDLAAAGFYFTGSGDCARCFHCGGGLRHWEPKDNMFVEHARWFSHCAFLPQKVGQKFIDIVQEMKNEMEVIEYDEVLQRMGCSDIPTPLKFMERLVSKDAAVQAVIDNGFDKDDVTNLALQVCKSGEQLSSDKLFEAAKANNLPFVYDEKNLSSDSVSIRKGGNTELDKETIETLRKDNGELRQISICKICMDTEVTVAFLPCGHFVSCTDCSFALNSCPLCRVEIKGLVKGYIGGG